MLPLKKILCPTDFSKPSLAALKTANELAEHFSSELIVLHEETRETVENPVARILPA